MIISGSDRVENIVGKGEKCWFLLFSCFEKASFPDTSKGVIVWEWIETVLHSPLSNQFTLLPANFYAPTSKDLGHNYFTVVRLSVCPSVCLHKLNLKT